jgi:hypothetical protein
LVEVKIEADGDGFGIRGAISREVAGASLDSTCLWSLEVLRPPTAPGDGRSDAPPSGGEGPRLEQRVRLRDREPARLLERTLHRPAHDAALVEAVAWVDELRGEELSCV